MQIERKWINNYVNSLDDLTEKSRTKLIQALSRLDPADKAFMSNVTASMQAICWVSCEQASIMARTFCEGMHVLQVGELIAFEAVSTYNATATAVATAGIMKDGYNERAVTELANRIAYEVRRTSGECIGHNVSEYSRIVQAYGFGRTAKSHRAKFARIPGYSETYGDGCPFCKMLASRGFVYRTPESAGEFDHYHAKCKCAVLPKFSDDVRVQDYDPDYYYQEWRDSVRKQAEKRAEKNQTSIQTEANNYVLEMQGKSKNARDRRKNGQTNRY